MKNSPTMFPSAPQSRISTDRNVVRVQEQWKGGKLTEEEAMKSGCSLPCCYCRAARQDVSRGSLKFS